jgi:hypothetical protein
MHLILNVHSSDANYSGDCDYAIVELTPKRAELIRNRVALAREARQRDSDLYELYFWGSPAQFYDQGILDACQDAIVAAGSRRRKRAARDWLADFERQEYAVVPDGVDFNAHESQRTECGQAILRVSPASHQPEFEIAWTAIPKHSDVYVTTHELPLEVMEKLLAANTPQPKT